MHNFLMHITKHMPRKIIQIEGHDYLQRYFVCEYPDGSQDWLHRFLRNDSERHLHAHPWTASSDILTGKYTAEEMHDGKKIEVEYTAGDKNIITPNTIHRIASVEPNTWTRMHVSAERLAEWYFIDDHGNKKTMRASEPDWHKSYEPREKPEPLTVDVKQLIADYENASDEHGWQSPHPIYLMAIKLDTLKIIANKLKIDNLDLLHKLECSMNDYDKEKHRNSELETRIADVISRAKQINNGRPIFGAPSENFIPVEQLLSDNPRAPVIEVQDPWEPIETAIEFDEIVVTGHCFGDPDKGRFYSIAKRYEDKFYSENEYGEVEEIGFLTHWIYTPDSHYAKLFSKAERSLSENFNQERCPSHDKSGESQ